ncbi:phytoene desaturase family protein [Anoxybacillus flavithermus]|uniref:Phytoene dehydrogenase (Phytoene desaturase) n=1 Tax=Anoxybacillus flavithermus (strain DSM 21510 / WK1) TaxID=491915 RepID=B7GLV8_ANOFW|nr:phytoene desaturase family protein [Anoxybacillus flavithermus]ACJ34559.1 Phytoene dehydrogenase (Phytoene desaturase) [Anoxybacillus flavithermus WK1]AST07995.1 phytoene desaturase [Anoxybacillus flavithermus]
MKVAIVGGGIGGMMTALLLAKRGAHVTIFEKNDRLGGRLSFIERDNFRIDAGPTIVLLPNKLRSFLSEVGVAEDEFELVPCDPMYTIHFADGISYTKYADEAKQMEEISRLFPGEEKGFQRFIDEMRNNFTEGERLILEKSFIKRKTFFTKETLSLFSRMRAYQSVKTSMSRYFQDERLQLAYSLQTLYIGGNPYTTPSLYSLVSFSEHAHGVYYVKGGYASLVSLLARKLEEAGVTVRLQTQVDRYEVNGSRVEGLYAKGEVNRFDAFVMNTDEPTMVTKKRDWVPSSSCVLLYMGLKKTYDARIHQFFLPSDFTKHMDDVFVRKVVPKDPSFYTFYPSAVDRSLAPEGKSVLYVLIPVPAGRHIDWTKQDRWLARMVDEVERRAFPNMKQEIEWLHVRTPLDAQKEGLYHGGMFGIAPTLFQSGPFRPQVKSVRYENVYAVGASVHPGGGVPVVMQGAKLCVEQLLRDWSE